MPEVTEMTINKGVTISMGNYEFTRVDVSATVKALPGESPETLDFYARHQVTNTLANALEQDVETRHQSLNGYSETIIRTTLNRDPVWRALNDIRPGQAAELIASFLDRYAPKPEPDSETPEGEASSE